MKTNLIKRTIQWSALSGALVIMLAGCGAETRDGAMDINRQELNRDHGYQNMQPNATNAPRMNNTAHRFDANTNMEMSQQIADGIAAMDEVETSYVMMAGNNAYVAVKLHPGAAISNGTNNDNNANGQDNGGNMNNNGMNTPNPDAATSIEEITPEVKEKIAAKVKELNANIKDVYVSANPDFMERMNVYANEFRNGRPLSGFVEEMAAIVERVFPTNAANDRPIMTP